LPRCVVPPPLRATTSCTAGRVHLDDECMTFALGWRSRHRELVSPPPIGRLWDLGPISVPGTRYRRDTWYPREMKALSLADAWRSRERAEAFRRPRLDRASRHIFPAGIMSGVALGKSRGNPQIFPKRLAPPVRAVIEFPPYRLDQRARPQHVDGEGGDRHPDGARRRESPSGREPVLGRPAPNGPGA
jgi:hypothetical protein